MKDSLFQIIERTFICMSVLLFSPLFSADTTPLPRKVQLLSHSVSTLDQEMATLQQKLQNQEVILDSIHREIASFIQATKEAQKKCDATTHFQTIEKNIEKVSLDLRQIRTHTNDQASLLAQLQKNVKKQEEISQLQAEQIDALESAMKLLASAMQVKTESSKSYTVKAGDTLDKIAKAHKTTVEAIKTKNTLEKATIFPGQKLQIP